MLSEPHAEELIRESLATLGDRALAGTDVLAGLRRKTADRTRRNRTLGVVAAAVAVVGVVAIPIGLHLGRSPSPASATGPSVRMPYTVRWVPPGWVANWRSVFIGRSQYIEQWTSPGGFGASLWASTTGDDAGGVQCISPGMQQVSINGVSGLLATCPLGTPLHSTEQNWGASVRWSPEPGWYLTVAMGGTKPTLADSKATVLRMARSVVADPSARLDRPFTATGAASDVISDDITVQGSAQGNWIATETVVNNSSPLLLHWGPGVTAPGGPGPTDRPWGQCVQTNAPSYVDCTLYAHRSGHLLKVEVGGPHLTYQQAVDITNRVRVNPTADYSWLGKP